MGRVIRPAYACWANPVPPGEDRCSFCGAHQKDVKRLIVGVSGKHICDMCVRIAKRLVERIE